ncbi:ABC transporter C family protein (macronuclear) [Tetrahymena thermophila SB210]|uniref:ABC transporter C family protein n=1 Tax=Tetrahymena thermophila (strain SB210) TaxID=312017 RepID=Q241Y1_TETTS|nr:ABC transporter C family protein [Tetrahymena thermophila SB210]EAS02570.2 ABC transporter C family protein [Tetrahymena thermophila SB210]|eukprot:XP_001022815.2 ABC transporter C family protein [Tetrahymena thermophila SB210]
MSSQKKVAIAEDSFNNQTSQSNQQEIDKAKVEEAKNKIISLEPTKKQRDIFCKEVLPNTEIKAREHNILFTGLTKLFKRTIELQKQEKQIQNEDIKDYITKSTQVKLLIEKLEDFKSRNPNDFGPTNFNLRSIYFNMTGKNLMIGLFYSIAQSLLSCGCVFIMDKITDMLKDYNGESSQKRDVCLLLLAISIGYIIKNVFYSRYAWYQAKFQANTYATLQYLVFSKSLRTQVMSASSSNEDGKGSGDGSDENPDANNIMTVDVDQQQYIFWAFVQTVQSIVTIAVVLYLIYYRIGSSIYNGLYILLASFCFNIIVTQLMRFFYTKLYKQKDARVSLSKDVIDGMKSIKYLGWEEIFKQKIEKIRSKEFRYIIITRILDGVLSIFWNCVSYFLLFFFLVSYVNDGHDLKDSNVFTIIALFGLLTGPIGLLPWSFGYLVKARVSYRRIKKFLNEKEINHNNVINLDLEFKQKTTNNSTDPNSLIESFQDNQSQNSVNNVAICIRKMKFDWPTKKSSKQIKMEEKEKKKQQKSQNKKGDTAQESLLGNQFENSSEIKENNKFQLKVLDLTVQKGDLAIIIGKIGSGKSALLQAILNELEMTSMDLQESLIASKIESSVLQEKLTNYEKKIIVNGKTGYVSQNHWLQNKTIKENILFGKEYDPFWYNECIESCDLKVDFSTFSKKDEKVIGPGGGNLSGGQRQRIAICRALYQNCDIYLFDDIFSSLDAHVAEKVYQQVIVDVLVKKYKKTVLLVTSHFSIFSKREYINKIFYLQKGSIVYEQQEIEDFIKSGLSKEQEEEEAKKQKQKLEIHVTSDDQLDKEEEDQEYDQIEELNELEDQEIQQLAIQKKSLQKSRSSQIEDEVVIRKKQSSKNQKIVDEEEEAKKQEEEEREKGSIKLETFTTYIKAMSYFLLIIFIISNFLMQASSMIMDFWLRDKVSTSSSFFERINELFDSFTNTFLFFILLNLGMTAIKSVFYGLCALRSGKQIFQKLNKSIIFSKMSFFDKNPAGRIVNRLSDDILSIDDYLPWNCQLLLEYIVYTIGYPVGILIQLPWLVVFVIISIIFVYFIQKLFRVSNREIKRLNSVNSGKLLTTLGEACKGLILIRSFDRERFILKEYMERSNDSVNTFLITEAIQIWMSIRLLFVSNFLFICVAVTSMILVGFNLDFDYITISMCLTYSMLLSSQFTDLIQFFCNVEQNMVSVERLRQYFVNDQEVPDQIELPEESIEQDEESHKKRDKDIAIEFENVYITYDEIKESTDISKESTDVQFALKDICLKIKKGEKIAFCGRTGSGKTSILNTLFNMYPIQHGNIYVNGKNIKSYCLRDLRSKMSIIPQFGFLYNASLKDNLDPEGKIPREQMQQKINETNLRIRDGNNQEEDKNKTQNKLNSEQGINHKVDINVPQQEEKKNEENLDFEIEDGGQNLSNGEKQVVNFLRIILRETDIVCLDEATSNMDPKTDAELHKQIFKFVENRTLIVITHRLENIELFDRVAVLEKGKIVECGHVNELRKIEGGFFNRLLKNHPN